MYFLFDIDGTLTPPRQKMEGGHVMIFLSWMANKNVYLVTGSDRKKILQQVPSSILSRCKGAFTCMGNEYYDNSRDALTYSNTWNVPSALLNDLNNFVLNSDYDTKCGSHIEHRPGMINFSVVGRAAGKMERDRYSDWDLENKERESVCRFVRNKYKDLDVSVGGQISIDINPKGNNKSQASKWIRNEFQPDEIVFFGDKCHKGGNDYDICLDLKENKDGIFWNVSGPDETFRVLENKY